MLKNHHKLYAIIWFNSAKKECFKGMNSSCFPCKYYVRIDKELLCDILSISGVYPNKETDAFNIIQQTINTFIQEFHRKNKRKNKLTKRRKS